MTIINSINNIPTLNPNNQDFQNQLAFELWSTHSCSDYQNDRNRPYDGQPWTDLGKRGKQEIKGLTMRDIVDCLIKAMITSSPPSLEFFDRFNELFNIIEGEAKPSETLRKEQNKFPHCKVELGTWRYQDIYKLDWSHIDPMAICQNLTCEIEKMMGIFPNLPEFCETSTINELLDKTT